MAEGLSASDILALTKDGDMGSMWNNPFVYLVWLALLGGGGFGGFGYGNTGGFDLSTLQSAIYAGNSNQDVFRNFGELTANLDRFQRDAAQTWGDIRYNMIEGVNSINANLAENRFAQQNCCCETNRNIDAVRAEAYKNTCDITTAIHSEGEATRALIEANTIQALRDKLEDKDRELLSANFALSQQAQNATLIQALRPFPVPAYETVSPYTGSATNVTCGCGGLFS